MNNVPQNNILSRLNNERLEKYDLEEKKMGILMYMICLYLNFEYNKNIYMQTKVATVSYIYFEYLGGLQVKNHIILCTAWWSHFT